MLQISLNPDKYDLIKHGTKRIEMSLLDEKKKALKVGDTMRYICRFRIPIQYIDVKITKIDTYDDFSLLVENYEPKDMVKSIYKKEKILEDLNKEYSHEEQTKNKVVAICFEKIEK